MLPFSTKMRSLAQCLIVSELWLGCENWYSLLWNDATALCFTLAEDWCWYQVWGFNFLSLQVMSQLLLHYLTTFGKSSNCCCFFEPTVFKTSTHRLNHNLSAADGLVVSILALPVKVGSRSKFCAPWWVPRLSHDPHCLGPLSLSNH